MTPERFQELRRAFEKLLELGPAERERSLDEIAARDAGCGAELRRLLAEHARATGLLDRSPAEILTRRERQIGPYLLEREIGSGGMGVVYEASRADRSFQRRVAIKILRRDLSSKLFLSRFDRERHILARLEHPHIAAIFDGGETPESDPYFVMELVDGIPITRYAETHGLTVAQRLDLFLQVCNAVQYAHRNLTVHRDLKPSNILVTAAGAVKLLDFGVAKLIETEAGGAEGAATEALLTPAYTSPEQIRREPASTSGDIFQLGILLYELLAGRHPFQKPGSLPHQVMRAICEDDPPPPSAVAAKDARRLRGELDAIVLTALRKEPSWRYASVEQMAGDVACYRSGWPVKARGSSAAYRLKKFARRQWLPLGAAGLLLVSLAGGMLATAYQAHRADLARASADRARAQAERQRALAETAQRTAVEERTLAEDRSREAQFERGREQERYREVRALASSLLFDLYDGVRDLAGSSTARKLIVTKAQQQLALLAGESGNDIGLERDLAACYERMGELRVDPRQPNKNDAAAALEDYRHAVGLRRKIAGLANATVNDRGDLALSMAKLGDGQFLAGDAKSAMQSYQAAWDLARTVSNAAPGNAALGRSLGRVDEHYCSGLLASGNASGAVEACRGAVATLGELARTLPDDIEVARIMATAEISYANSLRLSHKPAESAAPAKSALVTLGRLESLAPSNAEYRRLASSAETLIADSLAAGGDHAGSLAAFQRAVRSMEVALEIDPSDLRPPLRLAVTLLNLGRNLSANGDREGARGMAEEALQLLKQSTEKPGAGAVEWNEYADALLKVEWPDLRDPARALQLARNAVASSNRRNPFFLDTLAWAYFRTGDAAKAAETEREALRLLPADAKGGLHDELASGLNTFLGGAGK